MNNIQQFEQRQIVQSIRRDPIEKVRTLIEEASKNEIEEVCPSTNANLIFYAVQRTNDEEALEICQLILKKCPNMNVKATDLSFQTSLFFASRDGNTKTAEFLINLGCDVNHRDRASQTALFYAARDGRTDVVRLLLSHGADPNLSDNVGQTALFYAARDGRSQTCMLLLDKGADSAIKDKNRQMASSYALKNGHKQLANLLRNSIANTSNNISDQMGGINNSQNFLADASNVLKDSEIRQNYRLQFKGSDGKWYFATTEIIKEFEERYPNIAVWSKTLPVPPLKSSADPFRAAWHKTISETVDELRKQEGAWIFDKPVDEKAWNCSDYYSIIKKPMDFSLIRKKLRNGEYELCIDAILDIQQIFENCYLYNKPESSITRVCKSIEEHFLKLKKSKNIDEILDRERDLYSLKYI
ncbi:bromodomain-containing protein [Cryptosporidium andersoni]|uniref:Bromodomain-containing protein n=1 Tax=Cryptosporidium andersoni TaxID=117008 RepID=A0A1J4MVG5_9CRYT|nr:bromodomain-containing protein [Cryptosporidium andersoni]